jgi:hypothetical protein
VGPYLEVLKPRLTDTNEKTRNLVVCVFRDISKTDPGRVARYLDALEPCLDDVKESTREFTAKTFYRVSDVAPSRVTAHLDALRPLRNDQNDRTQQHVEKTLDAIEEHDRIDGSKAGDIKTDINNTDTKVFDPDESV